MEKLAGVILAAGLSSRMGTFKPLLEIGGVSMVRRVVQLMGNAGAEPVVVVTGHRSRELEEHLRGTGVELIHNPDYASTQQFDSFRLALACLEGRCRRILVSPADIPLVKPETVEALLETPGDFVRPVCRGRGGHPVLFSAALIPALLDYSGPDGLRGAIRQSGCAVRNVTVEDGGVLMDNDTPEDFKKTLEWSRR